MPATIVWNKPPLAKNRLCPLPLGAVLPQGKLKDALDVSAEPAAAFLMEDGPEKEAACARYEEMLDSEDILTAQDAAFLRAAYGATADKRILQTLLKALKALYEKLRDGEKIEGLAVGEMLSTALWLYNLTANKGLLELCRRLEAETLTDWTSFFHSFSQSRPAPAGDLRFEGVSLAEGLRISALQAGYLGGQKNETACRVGLEKMMRYHGAAHGLFNADPFLSGNHPSHGVSSECVQTLMDGAADLLWMSGDAFWGDWMEMLMENVWPHSGAVQKANQLKKASQKRKAGLLSYASNLWMANAQGGLSAIHYAPCQVKWRLQGAPVKITVETDYPRSEKIHLTVQTKQPVRFPLWLRIPAWAQGADLDGKALNAGEFAVEEREWNGEVQLTLTLPMQPKVRNWASQRVSVEYGPRVYALPAEQKWNVALCVEKGIETAQTDNDTNLVVWGGVCNAWKRSGDEAGLPPVLPRVEEMEQLTLKPYAELECRIAQFPQAGR